MSFWRGVMNAFGFGGDNDDDEEEYDSSLPTYAAQPQVTPPQPVPTLPAVIASDSVATDKKTDNHNGKETADKTGDAENDSEKSCVLADAELPSDLFDAVIELFNDSQPDFVKKCLSLDAQRQYIIDAISENLRRRITHTVDSSETDQLKERVKTLEQESQDAKAIRSENQKLHLSIERQKRAMLNRINDLESQVSKHHAEKEKILSAKFAHDDQPAAEITAENNAQDDNVTHVTEPENIAEGQKDLVEEQNDTVDGRDAQIAELEKTIESLKEQLDTQATLRAQLEDKIRISDEMINELRNRAAAERHSYEDTCHQQEIALEQIQQQVVNFEQVKARLENRILELKEALQEDKCAEREAQIARLSEENASLRHTIENNLYNQANSEMRLRKEIKQLKLELENALSATSTPRTAPDPAPVPVQLPTPMPPEDLLADDEIFTTEPPQRQTKRRGRPRKHKVEDELDNTDWFTGTGAHKDDPDFGYHEPPRRPSNDNEAQLTLF